MIIQFLLLFAMAAPPSDPLVASVESFRHVASYRVTIHSRSDDSPQIIRYYFKKPGYVRMEFIKPHKGAVLVYNPETKKARLRPFGFLKPLVLTLNPESALITSPTGHRIDASDLGAFLATVEKLAGHGKGRIIGTEKIGEREVLQVEVTGEEGFTVDGGVHRYLLWLDIKTLLPLKTKSFNLEDGTVEEVVMDDMEINVELPDTLFKM